ncbi:hypothetical protein GCM10022255_015600 [Dactylosporangium darangshiense]|uniref:Uncharacterized protein n=1 Tax=Dactylosporangium darangshiense TaxID=579108 RepID=A0ABP8D250_9ACTN
MLDEKGPRIDVVDEAAAVDVDTHANALGRGHGASRGDVPNGPSRGGRNPGHCLISRPQKE